MTPKEQAFHLYFKCCREVTADNNKAKKCAMITVDELIKETGSKYWYDVKSEINKL
jgi:hypothetical protein